MFKIKKFLPIEFYSLLVPSFFIFLFSILYLKDFSIRAFDIREFLKNIFYAGPFGVFFNFLITILFLLILSELSFYLADKIFLPLFKISNTKTSNPNTNKKNLLSICLIIASISFIAYSLTLFTNFLFRTVDITKIGKFGNIFLSWDKAIFNTSPGVWLINTLSGTIAEKVLLWAYNSIFIILALILLISLMLNKEAFRKLILSFFISWIIGLPLWFLFPVIPPDFMFRLNSLDLANVKEINDFNNINISTQLKYNLEFQEKVHRINQGPVEKSLPISTFPSMHGAWGVVIAYGGIMLWRWLGIFLVPWAILNGIGAVYILEHYSVDIFLGATVALISIIITEILLSFEKKYFEDKFNLLSGFDYIPMLLNKFFRDTNISILFNKIIAKASSVWRRKQV